MRLCLARLLNVSMLRSRKGEAMDYEKETAELKMLKSLKTFLRLGPDECIREFLF